MVRAGRRRRRWSEVLEVGRRFNGSLAALGRPAFIDRRRHPWSVGDRVAWEEANPPRDHPLLERLSAIRAPVDLPSQVIHGDLTENVLFADHLPPAVIDVTLLAPERLFARHRYRRCDPVVRR
jgi:hypothetical protein